MTLKIGVDVKNFSMAEITPRVEGFLGALHCPADLIFEIHLVVEELLVNVVQHGCSSDVELCLGCVGDQIVVELMDSGVAFDPLHHEVQDLDVDFEDRQIGGMGIYLVKELMDELSYKYENGKNILRAVKRFRK